jgi:hypothetical protein
VSSAGRRLIPRWYAATVVVGLAVFTAVLVATAAAFADGLAGASMWGLAASSALALVAAASALVRPRRPREPETDRDGSRVFRAPRLTVWPLLGAWIALLATAAAWSWLAVTDVGALESPGFWTLALGPEQLSYRGYRTAVVVPWEDVRGAVLQERGPAGVRIDLRGARTDPVVPITAFDVPAEQLVDEIVRAAKIARR